MARWVGRQLVQKIFRPFFFSALLILGVTSLIDPERGSAALLNGALNGSIEGAYIYNDIDQNGTKSSTRSIEQRYNLRYSENLLDPRLGLFAAGINWVDDQTSYSGTSDQPRRYIIKDYNINLSLFPMISPLTLFAQKTERENQFDFISHDTITTYGFGWFYSPLYLPRIGINGSHTTYTSDLAGLFPTSDTDVLTVDTGGRWREYNLSARYLFNQTNDTVNGSNWSHGVNLNLNGAVTRALTLGAYANYATRGGTASGMNFFQENALGMNFYYLPNKYWDSNLRLDFNEAPGMGDFKRYLISGGLNFHPTGKLDIFNNGQFARFETGSSQTDSLFANSAWSYRPLFGVTVAAGLGGGGTKLTGGGVSSKNMQGTANWSGIFLRTFSSFSARGSIGYSGSTTKYDSDLLGQSSDLINAFTASLDNTRIDYIHVGLNGSWTSIDRNVPAQSNVQQETRISLTADSHFFRNLFFFNDSLLLDATLTDLDVSGYGGASGESLSEDFHGTYQFLGIFTLIGAYSHLTYPAGYYGGNANIASVDFTGTLRPWENGTWTFDLKELVNDREDQYNQKTSEGGTKISHQLGRLTLSTEYDYLRNEAGPTVTVSQQFMVRAIRPF
jgi:hypothetical protein